MMNSIVQTLLVMLVISLLLMLISIFFVEGEANEMSETAFECGFEPFFMPRVPFSIHFFTVTVVFLIFDLEVIILMPVLFKMVNLESLLCMSFMIWILLVGLLVEWYDSSISWQL